MAIIPGSVPISGFVTPTDDSDVYPSHSEEWGRGGYRTVATLADRDAITTGRRLEGMLVNVIATGIVYQLVGGITNTDWTEFTAGGVTSNNNAVDGGSASSINTVEEILDGGNA
jgi:hypothetical protein